MLLSVHEGDRKRDAVSESWCTACSACVKRGAVPAHPTGGLGER